MAHRLGELPICKLTLPSSWPPQQPCIVESLECYLPLFVFLSHMAYTTKVVTPSTCFTLLYYSIVKSSTDWLKNHFKQSNWTSVGKMSVAKISQQSVRRNFSYTSPTVSCFSKSFRTHFWKLIHFRLISKSFLTNFCYEFASDCFLTYMWHNSDRFLTEF